MLHVVEHPTRHLFFTGKGGAVAVAIVLFGVTSGAVLAAVVGVLIEVPVMLALVRFANRTRPAFEARTASRA